jgi:hypothetical protein
MLLSLLQLPAAAPAVAHVKCVPTPVDSPEESPLQWAGHAMKYLEVQRRAPKVLATLVSNNTFRKLPWYAFFSLPGNIRLNFSG